MVFVPPGPVSSRRAFLLSQDVKCLLCGFVSGRLLQDPDDGPASSVYQPDSDCPQPPSLNRLRCCRCGGPVYLDEVERLLVPSNEPLEKPRRGRPRRVR